MKRFALFLFVGLWGCGASAAESSAQPNIIIILVDDMGYSDPGCYGGELNTPNIDRLAKEGVRLSHFHNGGMCVVQRQSAWTSTPEPGMTWQPMRWTFRRCGFVAGWS